MPYLGRDPLEGYFVATGHFRNGILLAPVTAQVVADAIEGRTPAHDLRPFARRNGGARAVATGAPVRASSTANRANLPTARRSRELLEQLGLTRRGIAVAVNDGVVPGSQHDAQQLRDGDRVEIIVAVAGG